MYSRQTDVPDKPDGQMFRMLEASIDEFFEANKSTIVEDIDLIKLFEGYRADPNRLEEYHKQMEDEVIGAIERLMADFNVANYLLGDAYAYLKPIDIQDEISTLIAVGQPTYRNPEMNATSPIRILLTDVAAERQSQWTAMITTLFPMLPIQMGNFDGTTLALLTIQPQKVDL